MPTTPRSTVSVDPGTPTVYENVLLTVSLPSLIGCVPIDFSWMHPWMWCAPARRQVSYFPIRWLLALISCRLSVACAISLTLTWRCVPKSVRHVRSVLLPFDNYEAYVDRCQTTWCSRSSWRWRFPAWLRLRNSCRSSEATHGQASVCAERRCTADI